MPGDTYMPPRPDQTRFEHDNVLEFHRQSRPDLESVSAVQAKREAEQAYDAVQSTELNEVDRVEDAATILRNLTITREYYLKDEAA